jgi:hypothetical protein
MLSNPFHKRFYKTEQGFKIFLVDGEKLKKKHIEFTEGSNYLVVKYIPKDEIWIDKYDKNIPAVIKHEVFEVLKMQKGMTYNKAHLLANRMEKKYRNS